MAGWFSTFQFCILGAIDNWFASFFALNWFFFAEICGMLSAFLPAIIARGWLLLIRNRTEDLSQIPTQLPWHVQLKVFEYLSKEDRKNYTTAFPWWRWLVKSYEDRLPEHTPEEIEQQEILTNELHQKIEKCNDFTRLYFANIYFTKICSQFVTFCFDRLLQSPFPNAYSLVLITSMLMSLIISLNFLLAILLYSIKYARQFRTLRLYLLCPCVPILGNLSSMAYLIYMYAIDERF